MGFINGQTRTLNGPGVGKRTAGHRPIVSHWSGWILGDQAPAKAVHCAA